MQPKRHEKRLNHDGSRNKRESETERDEHNLIKLPGFRSHNAMKNFAQAHLMADESDFPAIKEIADLDRKQRRSYHVWRR